MKEKINSFLTDPKRNFEAGLKLYKEVAAQTTSEDSKKWLPFFEKVQEKEIGKIGFIMLERRLKNLAMVNSFVTEKKKETETSLIKVSENKPKEEISKEETEIQEKEVQILSESKSEEEPKTKKKPKTE